MSPPTLPTDLEALAWAQTTKINDLSNQNQILAAQLSRQASVLEKYRASPSTTFPSSSSPSHTSSLLIRHPSPIPFLPHTTRPPSHPTPTPFYLDARSATQVQLSFVISGMQGESLPVKMNIIDLAFVLERTLERKGWQREMVRRGVEDFLEVGMVEVRWMGGEMRIGKLMQ